MTSARRVQYFDKNINYAQLCDSTQILRLHPNAPKELVRNNHVWELDLIDRCDGRVNDVAHEYNTFTTGLRVTPPKGWHIELITTPDFYKSGYCMNTPHLFFNEETDELIVHLYKYRDTEDLQLPFAGVQMCVKENIIGGIEYVAPQRIAVPIPQHGMVYGAPGAGYHQPEFEQLPKYRQTKKSSYMM